MDQLGNLIQAFAALAWPLIFIVILFTFRETIKGVLDSAKSRKFSIKVGGNELTMEEVSEQQRKIISDLQNQVVTIQKTLDKLAPAPSVAKMTAAEAKSAKVKSILWVDDNPRNNATLIENLSGQGVEVVTATSTAEALAKFEAKKFDRIISDMGRTEAGEYYRTAGLDLTRQIRAVDRKIPIIIYCSARGAQLYRMEALDAGANEITASPTILMNTLQLEPDLAAA